MKRICVFGGALSGKTTLSNKISTKLNLPILHMDSLDLAPADRGNQEMKKQKRQDYDNFVNNNKEWIIDGVYQWYDIQDRLRKADTLIVLLRPKLARLFTYIKTCIFPSNRTDIADYQKGFHWHMVKWIMREEKMSEKQVEELIADNDHLHIIKLRSFKQQEAFLKQL